MTDKTTPAPTANQMWGGRFNAGPDAIMQAYRQNPDALRGVESMVLEDQVVDHLLERALVTDQPATFKELMNFGA